MTLWCCRVGGGDPAGVSCVQTGLAPSDRDQVSFSWFVPSHPPNTIMRPFASSSIAPCPERAEGGVPPGASVVHVGFAPSESDQMSASSPDIPWPPNTTICWFAASYTAVWDCRAAGGEPAGVICVQVGVLSSESDQTSLVGPNWRWPPNTIIRWFAAS